MHPDTFTPRDFNGAKGLVFLGEHILVYRRDTKTKEAPLCLDLPGGGREGNESPFETFQREVQEEFGIAIKKEDIVFSAAIQSFSQPTKQSFFMVTKPLPYTATDVVFGNEGIEWFLMSPEAVLLCSDSSPRQQARGRQYVRGEAL